MKYIFRASFQCLLWDGHTQLLCINKLRFVHSALPEMSGRNFQLINRYKSLECLKKIIEEIYHYYSLFMQQMFIECLLCGSLTLSTGDITVLLFQLLLREQSSTSTQFYVHKHIPQILSPMQRQVCCFMHCARWQGYSGRQNSIDLRALTVGEADINSIVMQINT